MEGPARGDSSVSFGCFWLLASGAVGFGECLLVVEEVIEDVCNGRF